MSVRPSVTPHIKKTPALNGGIFSKLCIADIFKICPENFRLFKMGQRIGLFI